jgi:hypothetical protein
MAVIAWTSLRMVKPQQLIWCSLTLARGHNLTKEEITAGLQVRFANKEQRFLFL